jgi:hypothetical protein
MANLPWFIIVWQLYTCYSFAGNVWEEEIQIIFDHEELIILLGYGMLWIWTLVASNCRCFEYLDLAAGQRTFFCCETWNLGWILPEFVSPVCVSVDYHWRVQFLKNSCPMMSNFWHIMTFILCQNSTGMMWLSPTNHIFWWDAWLNHPVVKMLSGVNLRRHMRHRCLLSPFASECSGSPRNAQAIQHGANLRVYSYI